MAIKSINNSLATFRNKFARTGNEAENISFFSATGGNIANGIEPGNGFKYHTFGSPGTFIVTGSNQVDILAVGGGGAGQNFGGGGAGAVVHLTNYVLTNGTYPITVGSGGPVTAPQTPSTQVNGTSSTFGSIVTAGGGGGGPGWNLAGNPGGSGGGGAGSNSPGDPGGTAVNPGNLSGGIYYGNPGGTGGPRADGGGGGGAGGAGAPDPSGGSGGAGYPFPTFAYPLCFPSPYLPNLTPQSPNNTHYGGGGGGSQAESGSPRAGGVGGGGPSSQIPATNQSWPAPNSATAGTNYLGGGGGGGVTQSGVGGNPGAPGGNGVIIIRYQV